MELISRQAAIDAVRMVIGDNRSISVCDAIEQLPPIQPKRGKWTLKSYRWECDQCGCLIRRASPFKGNEWNYNFCPNCGADMRKEVKI